MTKEEELKRTYKGEERHPNIEQILWVLKHLNSIWKRDTTLKYVYERYAELKKEMEK